jgi:hypothetical protein
MEVAAPANSLEVWVHQASCSGRSLLRLAASSDSTRASTMNRPSSVTPTVEPSQPRCTGRQLLDPPFECGAHPPASDTWIN